MSPTPHLPALRTDATMPHATAAKDDCWFSEPLCSSPYEITADDKPYLFPLTPSRINLVQFAPAHSLVRVHETWSQDEYDRSPCFARRPDRLSPIDDSDSGPDVDTPPALSKARQTLAAAKLYRGQRAVTTHTVATDSEDADYLTPVSPLENVAMGASRLLELLQTNDHDAVDCCE